MSSLSERIDAGASRDAGRQHEHRVLDGIARIYQSVGEHADVRVLRASTVEEALLALASYSALASGRVQDSVAGCDVGGDDLGHSRRFACGEPMYWHLAWSHLDATGAIHDTKRSIDGGAISRRA